MRSHLMFPQLFLILFLLILLCCRMSDVVAANSSKCLQDQKMLLLQLRNNLTYDFDVSTKLVKWGERIDCCQWEGVTCNAAGQVIGLDLTDESFSGSITPLENLKFLSEIRLDRNSLSAPIPDFFADFSNLTVLSLKFCNLTGEAPQKIFQVPTLQTLDLSENYELGGSLPEFPSNGSLQSLLLSYTPFSGTLPKSVGNLRMLSVVDFFSCNFTGPIPSSIENLTRLVFVDFFYNNFTGSIPSFRLSKNLTYVNLRGNYLTGELISSNWDGLENLGTLDLSENSLSGLIPPSLFSLPSLHSLLLSNNKLYGQITDLKNLTSPLTGLDLRGNNLDGPLPEFFFQLLNLSRLSLSSNNFNGTVRLHNFTNLKKLYHLDLSHNSLSVDANISEADHALLPQLLNLRLASCNLQTISFLKNQTGLATLDLSNNHIRGQIPNWIWENFHKKHHSVNLSHNQFTHLQEPYEFGFPDFIDLHANLLTGKVPLPPRTSLYVDLSSNKFDGGIPPDYGNYLSIAWFFSIANNKVSGTIPSSICNTTSLKVLDLSSNSLNGTIPACLAERSSRLIVLNLGGNNLRGNIPGNFPEACSLLTLDLRDNFLTGKIPRSLSNCSHLKVLNIGNNKISDTFPCWLRRLSYLHVLVLRFNNFHGNIDCSGVNYTWLALQIIDLASNKFSGILPRNLFLELEAMTVDSAIAHSRPDYLHSESTVLVPFYYQDTVTLTLKGQEVSVPKIFSTFKSIDFSNNTFVGGIPETVGELTWLRLLNLSRNALTGHIPPVIGNLKQLGSLDLSFNKLNGHLPEELSGIPRLGSFNVSYNELVGMIPQGAQIRTFPDSFMGNKGLCGFPLNKPCRNNDREHTEPVQPAMSEDEQFFSMGDIYASAAVGFVVALAVIFLPLLFCKAWRECYNKLVDGLIFWMFRKQVAVEKEHGSRISEIYWRKKTGKSCSQVPSPRR